MNTALSPREHARLARALIAACGGLAEAAEACRVSASKLSDYQNPSVCLFMPADVQDDLQVYCGRPIYSDALSARFSREGVRSDLRAATCELTEAAAMLQHKTREALADGELSPNENDSISAVEHMVDEALEMVRATRRAAEADATRPTYPKAVG